MKLRSFLLTFICGFLLVGSLNYAHSSCPPSEDDSAREISPGDPVDDSEVTWVDNDGNEVDADHPEASGDLDGDGEPDHIYPGALTSNCTLFCESNHGAEVYKIKCGDSWIAMCPYPLGRNVWTVTDDGYFLWSSWYPEVRWLDEDGNEVPREEATHFEIIGWHESVHYRWCPDRNVLIVEVVNRENTDADTDPSTDPDHGTGETVGEEEFDGDDLDDDSGDVPHPDEVDRVDNQQAQAPIGPRNLSTREIIFSDPIGRLFMETLTYGPRTVDSGSGLTKDHFLRTGDFVSDEDKISGKVELSLRKINFFDGKDWGVAVSKSGDWESVLDKGGTPLIRKGAKYTIYDDSKLIVFTEWNETYYKVNYDSGEGIKELESDDPLIQAVEEEGTWSSILMSTPPNPGMQEAEQENQ